MRHPIAAALIVASTVAAGAQSSSQPATAAAGQTAGKSASVSGCLAAGPAANTFTLTTAEADLKAVGTTGVAGSPEASAPKVEPKTVIYTLTPRPGVDLTAHVGHTVEVRGMEPRGGQPGTTGQSRNRTTVTEVVAGAHPTPTAQTPARPEIVARRMNVSAVKMVASDCRVK
jgi:hypothetical protein